MTLNSAGLVSSYSSSCFLLFLIPKTEIKVLGLDPLTICFEEFLLVFFLLSNKLDLLVFMYLVSSSS